MRRLCGILLSVFALTVILAPQALFAEGALAGCIQVYDASGQYLGLLVERGKMQDEAVVFIPGINKFAAIQQTTGEIESTNLTFETNGCIGTPYFAGGVDFIRQCNGKYYVGGAEKRNLPRVSTLIANGECLQWSSDFDKLADMFAATEIPESDIPFSLPVALPLRY